MKNRDCEIVIVMPTLDVLYAGHTMNLALETAGVSAGSVVVSDKEMRGAVRSSNVAMKAAIDWGARYVVYLNDDALCKQQGWLARLIEAVNENQSYGVAAPGGKCNSVPQRDCKPGLSKNVCVVDGPLAWFCAVIKSSVFNAIGYFDEGFIHYADETDFMKRAFAAGFKNIYVQDVYIEHGLNEKSKLQEEWRNTDMKRYHEKWG